MLRRFFLSVVSVCLSVGMVFVLFLLVLRVIIWNVRGLNDIKQKGLNGRRFLNNFKEFGDFDFMLLYEYKLKERDIVFVYQRMGFYGIWLSVENIVMGGFVILIGYRYVDKIFDTGVDKENMFFGVKVVIYAGVVGIVNTYALYKFYERVRIW